MIDTRNKIRFRIMHGRKLWICRQWTPPKTKILCVVSCLRYNDFKKWSLRLTLGLNPISSIIDGQCTKNLNKKTRSENTQGQIHRGVTHACLVQLQRWGRRSNQRQPFEVSRKSQIFIPFFNCSSSVDQTETQQDAICPGSNCLILTTHHTWHWKFSYTT